MIDIADFGKTVSTRVKDIVADPILDSLNKAQKEAVTFPGRHLLVFAGPGTGKTRVITHRIAYLILRQGLDPETILAITFTNKAASAMKARMSALMGDRGVSPWMGTFHAFAHWLIRRHSDKLKISKDFVIYDQDDQKSLMREILAESEIGSAKAGLMLDIIQRLKDDLMDAHSYAIHSDVASDQNRSQIAKIYLAYQEALRSRGALDFGDLLMQANQLFREFPAILKSYQERFGSVFVDEYQDVNRAQYALIKLLAADGTTLTCVADDDQVIYEWRNANPRYTLDFEKEFKDAGFITLTENYRSTSNILRSAGRLIGHNEMRKNKDLSATRGFGEDPQALVFADERQEARGVSLRVKELIEGSVKPSEIAVFYRINAQSRNFEFELRSRGIPYRLIGALGFYARREIKDILAFARILVNPKDDISLARILTNYPAFAVTRDALSRIKEAAQKSGDVLWSIVQSSRARAACGLSPRAARKMERLLEAYNAIKPKLAAGSIVEAFEAIVSSSDYLQELEEDRVWNIQELIRATGEHEKENPGVDLGGFLSHTSLLASVSFDNARETGLDAVNLMTVHLAKGLEFEAVFLTGMEDGLFPFKISRTNPREIEEERRLFYVGMTRAKDQLFLTRAETRVVFGSQERPRPSRFLFEAGVMAQEEGNKLMPKCGFRVKHPLYGEGRIKDVSGADENAKVTVVFMGGSTRKFLFKVAPLEIL